MDNSDITKIIDKMINEPSKITAVQRGDSSQSNYDEFYFEFPDGKYKWSILEDRDGDYRFFYYPDKDNDSQFLVFDQNNFDPFAAQSLRQLYNIVKNKVFGFDKVVEDILS